MKDLMNFVFYLIMNYLQLKGIYEIKNEYNEYWIKYITLIKECKEPIIDFDIFNDRLKSINWSFDEFTQFQKYLDEDSIFKIVENHRIDVIFPGVYLLLIY